MVENYHKKGDYSKFKPVGYPVRHRRKIPFYPMLSLGIDYREIVMRIRELDRTLGGFVLSSTDYLELINDAFSDNIHWTTKIEGNNLSLDDVRRLTTRFTRGERIETSNGPKQEILNHLYSFFAKDEFGIPWDMDKIRAAHRILMKGVNKDVTPGMIRDEDVSVVGSDGTEYFISCPPESIGMEMDSLIEWLNGSPFDEIITATLFFHEFESIHPFKDGNGRTGRTLFQILLQELGLKNCKLCKFEKELLSDTATYYDLLAYADSTGIYSQLVMYVAESLLIAYEKAIDVFRERDRLSMMDENTRTIVRNAKGVKSFTFREASQWIPGMGLQSLRECIHGLAEIDIIQTTGKTRGMRYSFKDPLFGLKDKIDQDENH